jgi:hypothetical protein
MLSDYTNSENTVAARCILTSHYLLQSGRLIERYQLHIAD